MAENAMEDLEAAWDASDTTEDESVEAQDDDLRFGGQVQEEASGELPEVPDEAGEEGAEGGLEEPVAGEGEPSEEAEPEPAVAADPAPASWGPATREHWKDLPAEVKAEVQKRERDFSMGIQRYAEGAKRAGQMDQALQPFQQYLATNGDSPSQTIGSLLQTASLLQMGTPMQKATMMHQLINQFGIDVQALDHMLAGEEQPPEVQNQQYVQQAVQQAVAPYQQMLAQQQGQQQYAVQQRQQAAAQDITAFASNPQHEFYGDVRADMADILDMAANRGLEMSLPEAYKRACAVHPEISKIVGQRQQQLALQSKKNAARSVSGTPGGDGGSQAPNDIRGAIDFAWENSGRT